MMGLDWRGYHDSAGQLRRTMSHQNWCNLGSHFLTISMENAALGCCGLALIYMAAFEVSGAITSIELS